MKIYNTGETEEDLRKEYNPDGSTLRRAQLRLLDMLQYLSKVAKDAGVPCRIDGGNVLGALRHGGFIPWDDDVDVVVHWRDLKRLCDAIQAHPHPQYVLQTNKTDHGYYKPWPALRDLKSEHVSMPIQPERERRSLAVMQMRGLHIDIFPYEGYMIPWLQRLAAKLSCAVNFDLAGRFPFLTQLSYSILEKVVFPVFRFVGHIFGNPKNYMHSYGAWFYERNPEHMMIPHRDIEFEGLIFEGPADPDGLCRIAYGNYMELPPRDKRNRHQVEIKFID